MPGIGDGELDEAAAIAHLACRKLDLARFGEFAGIAQEVARSKAIETHHAVTETREESQIAVMYPRC